MRILLERDVTGPAAPHDEPAGALSLGGEAGQQEAEGLDDGVPGLLGGR
jgi:hypothetical protein